LRGFALVERGAGGMAALVAHRPKRGKGLRRAGPRYM